jgi:voltage-gated sodium channel
MVLSAVVQRMSLARRIADDPRFQHFILGVIVTAAVVIGVETSPALTQRYGGIIVAVEMLIQTIFVAEMVIRILACWPRPASFFRNGWNVFDFAVVAASLLPQAGAFAMVARLARLMRITRLVSAFPELRLIIGTMVKSIPSMGHVIVLLSLLLYVYAVLGFHFFRGADPEHWRSLGTRSSVPSCRRIRGRGSISAASCSSRCSSSSTCSSPS